MIGCMYVYVCMYVFICIFIDTAWKSSYFQVAVAVRIDMYVRMYVCMCMHIRTCMYVLR